MTCNCHIRVEACRHRKIHLVMYKIVVVLTRINNAELYESMYVYECHVTNLKLPTNDSLEITLICVGMYLWTDEKTSCLEVPQFESQPRDI